MTIALCEFCLNLNGDGMPKNWDRYMKTLAEAPRIQLLREFLENKSGKEWSMLMSSSY